MLAQLQAKLNTPTVRPEQLRFVAAQSLQELCARRYFPEASGTAVAAALGVFALTESWQLTAG